MLGVVRRVGRDRRMLSTFRHVPKASWSLEDVSVGKTRNRVEVKEEEVLWLGALSGIRLERGSAELKAAQKGVEKVLEFVSQISAPSPSTTLHIDHTGNPSTPHHTPPLPASTTPAPQPFRTDSATLLSPSNPSGAMPQKDFLKGAPAASGMYLRFDKSGEEE